MHTAFGPQGEGLQGSTGFDDSSIAKFNNIKKRKLKSQLNFSENFLRLR